MRTISGIIKKKEIDFKILTRTLAIWKPKLSKHTANQDLCEHIDVVVPMFENISIVWDERLVDGTLAVDDSVEN